MSRIPIDLWFFLITYVLLKNGLRPRTSLTIPSDHRDDPDKSDFYKEFADSDFLSSQPEPERAAVLSQVARVVGEEVNPALKDMARDEKGGFPRGSDGSWLDSSFSPPSYREELQSTILQYCLLPVRGTFVVNNGSRMVLFSVCFIFIELPMKVSRQQTLVCTSQRTWWYEHPFKHQTLFFILKKWKKGSIWL